MRADAPAPSRERLEAGRERLLTTVQTSHGKRPVVARRRVGRMRAMMLASGLAAVTAAAVVAVQGGYQPDPAPQPRTVPAAESAEYDDVLVERAAFGWLPHGLRANSFIADAQDPAQPFFEVTANGGDGRNVSLTAYAAGKEPILPRQPGGIPSKRIPARPINGRPAYWVSTPNMTDQLSFELRWQYAPKSWANLVADLDGSTAELTRIAYRIAESASFGGERPIAMPLHVDGVPGGLTPNRVVLNKGAFGELSAMLIFVFSGMKHNMGVSITKADGTVGTGVPERPGGPIAGLPRPNTTLKGHPVHQTPRALYAYGVNGFDVQINATGSVLAQLNKTGGVAGLFRRTTVFGIDQANWTTNPVN